MVRGFVFQMKLDELVDSRGRTLPVELRNEMRTAILRAITHPESDVSAVVRRAKTIAKRALDGEIRDVLHYATKALFATSRKHRRLFQKESDFCRDPLAMVEIAGTAVEGSPTAIEAKIFVGELLRSLSQIERTVLLRHTMGWQHRAIGKELNISAAMSSYHLLRAKARLHSQLQGNRSGSKKNSLVNTMAFDSFENLLLQAHPNPDRRGCPGTAQLKSLAENPPPLDDPISVHVRECSPCFAEFRTFRDVKRAASKRQTVWRITSIAAATAALFWIIGRPPSPQTSPIEIARLNFSNDSAERGTDTNAAPLPSIPVGSLLLQITLPAGTDPGEYDLEIRSAANLSNTLKAPQTLSLRQGNAITYRLSPPALPAGNYALAWRSHGTPLWHYSCSSPYSKGRPS